MNKKCAVVCSHGLGDGLIFLTLSHNFALNGYEVDTYHKSLAGLQRWFSQLPIKPIPKAEEIPSVFSTYDTILVNGDHLPENILIQRFVKEKKAKSSWIFHPSTCRAKNLPGDICFDTDKSVVLNLLRFCEQEAGLSQIIRANGITPPKNLIYRKEAKRVVFHPTSRNEKRNWPSSKFLKLAMLLKKEGYDPCFMVAPFERSRWEWVQFHGIHLPVFSSLDGMASFLYESGFFIGMDSGIGHLASCMQLPTLTIFACKRKENFWKPDWGTGKTVVPHSFLPNIKGLRLRDKYWKPFLKVSTVLEAFLGLAVDAKSELG